MSAEPGTTAPAERPGAELPAVGFLLLAGMTLFWGVNWPIMKMAMTEIPVWTFRAMILSTAGVGLLAIARLSGQSPRLARPDILPLSLCTLFNIVGWHLCSGYGVTLMEAGRASIIAFTMPIWAALLSVPILGERFGWRKVVGLVLGMAGLAVLIGPDLAALGRAPLGAVFMLGAAVSWAIGTVGIKRFAWRSATTTLVGWQLLIGALPISIGMLLHDGLPDLGAYSSQAWLATLYVVALPMLFCHWAYFRLVRLFPASVAAIGTLAIPVVGVLSSAVVLGEAIGPLEIGALALVCSALAVVLLRPGGTASARPGG